MEYGKMPYLMPCLERVTNEKARTVLDQGARVTLSKQDFLAFEAAVAGAFVPNAALQKAIKVAARVKRA